MTFGTRKVFGTFEKRTPELDLDSIADIRVVQVLLCGIRFCLLGSLNKDKVNESYNSRKQ